jgi:hypothetical protein
MRCRTARWRRRALRRVPLSVSILHATIRELGSHARSRECADHGARGALLAAPAATEIFQEALNETRKTHDTVRNCRPGCHRRVSTVGLAERILIATLRSEQQSEQHHDYRLSTARRHHRRRHRHQRQRIVSIDIVRSVHAEQRDDVIGQFVDIERKQRDEPRFEHRQRIDR